MRAIVMTGGTSGFGEYTARRLLSTPNTRLIMGARSTAPAGVETIPLDMTRLANVRSFVTALNAKLGNDEIDALVLNAGMSPSNDEGRTPDGFETAFAVNHLAHYLMIRLLLPRLAQNAVVSLTTSGTHDPAEGTIIPPPRHADARLLAHPDQDPQRDTKPRAAGGRAYSSSKLCSVLTARALAAQPEAIAKNLTVLAYDPGPTPGTGLLRNAPPVAEIFWRVLGGPTRKLVKRFNSKEAAGGNLAEIALGRVHPPAGRYYAATRQDKLIWLEPSELARSQEAMETLWRDSAPLVGLRLSGHPG